MHVVDEHVVEIESSSYTSLIHKPLSFALILSIFLHLAVIVIAFYFLKNVNLSGILPSNQAIEISLLKATQSKNQGAGSKIEMSENEYIEIKEYEIGKIALSDASVTVSSEELPPPEPAAVKKLSNKKLVTFIERMNNKLIPSLLVADVVVAEVERTTKGIVIETPQQAALLRHLELIKDQIVEGDFKSQLEIEGRLYSIKIGKSEAQNNTDLERVNVEVSTLVAGESMSTNITMKRLAFSSYAQVINKWDPDVTFSKDVIDGRFHSNTRINLAKGRNLEPTFMGKVTVSSGLNARGRSIRERIFPGGLETRVKRVNFPERILEDLPQNAELIHIVEADINITFLEGGGYRWYFEVSPSEIFHTQYAESTRYILGGEGVKVSICGAVKGSIVVHALDRISISGDLLYVDHPEKNPNSKDYIGIISENYVEIDSPSITGRGDITVHAAIFAKRRFLVRHSRSRTNALLTILGSLSAGTVGASEPRFATVVKFDQRFEDRKLPGFPVTDKYELEAWDTKWHINGNDL